LKKLRPYQIDALHYLRSHRHGALFMEMRLGKTLSLIRHIKQLPNINRVLIVAPYSALDGWQEELNTEGIDSYTLFGNRKERLDCLALFDSDLVVNPSYFLINKEGFLSIPEIARSVWDVVILDESTFIKTPWHHSKGKLKSKTTFFFCNNFRNVKHRFILTGTPDPEGELDYFCQLLFLDPSILGFKNYWEFRLKCFAQFGYDWQIKPQDRQWLPQRLATSCFFLKRKEVNLGGETIIENRMIELPKEQQAVYDKLEEDFILEYQNIQRQTMFAGAKYTLMRQLCGGFADGQMVSDHKILVLQELLDGELKGQQIVIWAWYVNEVKYIAKLLKCPFICGDVKPGDREIIRKGFQKGISKYIVVQPEVWKFGTTLSAAETMIYYSLPEGYLTYQQSKDRALDLEKQNSILLINLLVKNTVDVDGWDSLLRKEDKSIRMRSLINAAKKRRT
jgi:hypothetical protein